MTSAATHDARRFLHMAARLGWRGHGLAEPNPLVGCIIVAPDGRLAGWGYHRCFGGPHAEVVALGRAGAKAAGATVYVTLEPCNHHGKTGPCTEALIKAKVARIVIARRDPNPIAAGGLERLRSVGIVVDVVESCGPATRLSDPFVHRVRTGLPWVIAKWAQTLDGALATRSSQSRWISGESSRRLVHRERGRVDAILTGIGTVIKDDPLLTARCARRRRIARRVVVDPKLQIPLSAKIITTAGDAPTTIACLSSTIGANPDKARALRNADVELIGIAGHGDELPLDSLLQDLVSRHDAANVLVEAGPGLLRRLFEQRLICEAWVFTAPILLGDDEAIRNIGGRRAEQITDGVRMRLTTMRSRSDDVVATYRIAD